MSDHDEQMKAVLTAAVHVAAEQTSDDKNPERLDAWIEQLSIQLQKFLNMDRIAYRAVLHRTTQADEHLYPLGPDMRFDDESIARGDFRE